MSEFVDYYEVLQVHPRADAEVIDKAYRVLIAKQHHDAGGDLRETQLINEAYEVIGKPASRAAYDAGRGFAALESQAQDSRTARDLAGMEQSFRAGRWPDTSEVREAFADAWISYEDWADGSQERRADRGAAYVAFQAGVGRLMTAADDEFPLFWPYMTSFETSFAEASGAAVLWRGALEPVLGKLPEGPVARFPKQLEDMYRLLSRGILEAENESGKVPVPKLFVALLAYYLRFVFQFEPTAYAELAEMACSRFRPRGSQIIGLDEVVSLAASKMATSEWEDAVLQCLKAVEVLGSSPAVRKSAELAPARPTYATVDAAPSRTRPGISRTIFGVVSIAIGLVALFLPFPIGFGLGAVFIGGGFRLMSGGAAKSGQGNLAVCPSCGKGNPTDLVTCQWCHCSLR